MSMRILLLLWGTGMGLIGLAYFLMPFPAPEEPSIGFITFSALHESVQCAYVKETLEIIFCEGLGNR